MVTLHLPNSIVHTNTLLHREPCCVLSGRTQMAATWCVLMGSCDGFGQDMDTHTDGDPLRVAGRWTCWLLICSDQWFTTWSSDTGRVAPTELAQWLGKHHCIYAGDKSTKSTNCHFSDYILKSLDTWIWIGFISPSPYLLWTNQSVRYANKNPLLT